MRALIPALILAMLPAASYGDQAKPVAGDPVLEQRMIALAADLRCLVCQNESLAGSPASLANDLREEIRELMRAGKSDEEIIRYLTERYGDFVLYRPPLRPTTWLLWFGPFLLLGAGAGGLFAYLKARNRRIAASGPAPADREQAHPPIAPGSEGP